MKQTYLKKLLIKIALICLITVLLTSGMYYGSLQYADNTLQARDQSQTQATIVINENNALMEKIKKSSDSYGIYEKIVRNNSSQDFSLNREGVSKLIKNQLQPLFPFTSLEMTISPIKDLAADPGRKITHRIVYCEVNLRFKISTDTAAFNFLKALSSTLPGLVNYTSIKLTRTGEIGNNVYQDIVANRIPALVDGDVNFNWLGVVPHPETKKSAGASE